MFQTKYVQFNLLNCILQIIKISRLLRNVRHLHCKFLENCIILDSDNGMFEHGSLHASYTRQSIRTIDVFEPGQRF